MNQKRKDFLIIGGPDVLFLINALFKKQNIFFILEGGKKIIVKLTSIQQKSKSFQEWIIEGYIIGERADFIADYSTITEKGAMSRFSKQEERGG